MAGAVVGGVVGWVGRVSWVVGGAVDGGTVVGAAVVGGVVTAGSAVTGVVVGGGSSVGILEAGTVVAGVPGRATVAGVVGVVARTAAGTATLLVVVLDVLLGTDPSVGLAGVPAARRSPTTTVDSGWSTVRWGPAAFGALFRAESREVAIMISATTTTPTTTASSVLWRNA